MEIDKELLTKICERYGATLNDGEGGFMKSDGTSFTLEELMEGMKSKLGYN